MKPVVTYADGALADIIAAMRWYKGQRPGLEERFLQAVLKAEAFIRLNPKAAQLVRRRYRQWPLEGFPYVLILKERPEEVLIYRVFHTSRDPRKRFRKR